MWNRIPLVALNIWLCAGMISAGTSDAWAQQEPQAPQRASSPALTISAASLQVSPKAREHYERAVAASKAHRDQECDRELEQALERAPAFPEAHLLRAEQAIREQHEDAAIVEASEARRLDARLVWIPVVLAQAYNGLHRYAEAQLNLASLEGAARTSWQAKYERARAEVGLRHAEAALYWSTQTLAAVPATCVDAHILYADALQLSGRWREASNQFDLYIASSGGQPQREEVLAALAFTERMAREQIPPAPVAR